MRTACMIVPFLLALAPGAFGAQGDAAPASGEPMTAAYLRDACDAVATGRAGHREAICGAYILGFVEGEALQASITKMPTAHCRREATILEIAQAYVRWYDAGNAAAVDSAAVSLGTAILDTYPCGSSR